MGTLLSGGKPTLHKRIGPAFVPVPVRDAMPLNGVFMETAERTWIVGGDGRVEFAEGDLLSVVPTGLKWERLLAVSGDRTGGLWAAGDQGRILRWDGAAWRWVGSPFKQAVLAGWMADENDGWAVGEEGLLLRYQARSWNPLPAVTPNALRAVWGSGSNDVWMAGDAGSIGAPRPPRSRCG